MVESESEEDEEEEEEEEEHNDTTRDSVAGSRSRVEDDHDEGDVSEEDDEESEEEDDLVTSKTTKRIVDDEDEDDEEEDYDMEVDMSVDHEGEEGEEEGNMSVVVDENEGEVVDGEIDMSLSPSKRSPLATRTSISANNASPVASNMVANPSPSQKENVIVKKRDESPELDTNAAVTTPTTPSKAPPSSMPLPSPIQANMTIDDGAPDGLPLPRSSQEPDEVKQEEQLSHGIHARSLMQQRATSMQQHVIKTPDEPTQRLTISNLVLTNFKSYAGRQEVGPFHSVSIVEVEDGWFKVFLFFFFFFCDHLSIYDLTI